jgi:hypothetical protein
MTEHFSKKIISFFSFFILIFSNVHSLSLSDFSSKLADIFDWSTDENEGTTSFRSLLIPFGGRSESLGSAFTGLSDDISFLQFNPAGSALQKQTQLSIFHNAWIADSKLDTIAYTTRFKNLGLGTYFSCFYVPFSEYNNWGDKVSSSYYSESVFALNVAYNFLAGYDFKGITVGASLKTAWRGMPDYTDKDSDEIISTSGISQSSLAFMADFGAMLQFNFLKFFASRDPNVRIGIAAQNLGAGFTGFSQKIEADDGLPSSFSVGISIKPLKYLTFSVDFKQPVNFFYATYLKPYIGFGASVQFTDFLAVLAGFEIKGGNPKISAGFEFEVSKIRMNFNYSLDLTTSYSPVNKISLCAKMILGDRGRSDFDSKVDELYKAGLVYYTEGKWEEAIETWNKCLKLNRRFDPARKGIASAESIIYTIQTAEEFKKLN